MWVVKTVWPQSFQWVFEWLDVYIDTKGNGFYSLPRKKKLDDEVTEAEENLFLFDMMS